MNDLDRTIHYTTHAAEICNNLISYIPKEAYLVEPFVGDGDLIQLFPDHEWEFYDIEDVKKGDESAIDDLIDNIDLINGEDDGTFG